jgi:cation transport ATPase
MNRAHSKEHHDLNFVAAFSPEQSDTESDHGHTLNWPDLNRVLFIAAAAVAIYFLHGTQGPYVTGIGMTCTLAGGFPIFHEAYENITQRRMTMELSMTIAIVAALAIREVFTALIITLFVLVAEILEDLTVGRGRQAIQRLVDLLPRTATVRLDGEWRDVGIGEISAGSEVLVRPGARVPVDGRVLRGHSFVDQAPITGESMPVEKGAGARVYAGTINQSGALRFTWNISAATRLLARSLRPWSERRSHAPNKAPAIAAFVSVSPPRMTVSTTPSSRVRACASWYSAFWKAISNQPC